MWIDHDDGHAGGYPHECKRCTCGHRKEDHGYAYGNLPDSFCIRHGCPCRAIGASSCVIACDVSR